MLWKIHCYNGTIWKAQYQMPILVAIKKFCKETELFEWDIKYIENLS